MSRFIAAVKHEIYLVRQKLRIAAWANFFSLWK